MLFDFGKYFYSKSITGNYSRNDCCRMAAYFVQDGYCYVTHRRLEIGERELHHRLPRSLGGKDTPENLILLNRSVHRMVHSKNWQEYAEYAKNLNLTQEELSLIGQLRFEAQSSFIS